MKKILLLIIALTTMISHATGIPQIQSKEIKNNHAYISNTKNQQSSPYIGTKKTDPEIIIINIFEQEPITFQISDPRRLKPIFLQLKLLDINLLQKLLFLIMLMITTIGNAMQTVQLKNGSLTRIINDNSIKYEFKKNNKSTSIYKYDSEMEKYYWNEIILFTHKNEEGRILVTRSSSVAKKAFKKIKAQFNFALENQN